MFHQQQSDCTGTCGCCYQPVWNRFTLLPVLFLFFLAFFFLDVLFSANLLFFLAMVAIFAVPIYVMHRMYRPSAADPDMILKMVAFGFLPGMLLALFMEIIITVIIGSILRIDIRDVNTIMGAESENTTSTTDYGDSPPLTKEQALSEYGTFRIIIFLFLMAYCVAAAVEELIKLMAVRFHSCSPPCCLPGFPHGLTDPWSYIIYMTAAAMV